MVEIGQKVYVHYTGALDDGTEFDSSVRRGEPLELVVGSKKMLPLFEKAVSEMSLGEKRIIQISAEQAYGMYDATLMLAIPASDVPNIDTIPVGKYIVVATSQGSLRVKVVCIENGLVHLDYNHELAGQNLTFDIQLISIEHSSAIERELHSAGCACGCDKLKQSLGF